MLRTETELAGDLRYVEGLDGVGDVDVGRHRGHHLQLPQRLRRTHLLAFGLNKSEEPGTEKRDSDSGYLCFIVLASSRVKRMQIKKHQTSVAIGGGERKDLRSACERVLSEQNEVVSAEKTIVYFGFLLASCQSGSKTTRKRYEIIRKRQKEKG